MSKFHVGGKVVEVVDLLKWRHWPWRLDVWPFAILYAVWLIAVVPSIDFGDAAIVFGGLLAIHILVLLFTAWSVDFRCFVQSSKAKDIHHADSCKITPAKFSGSKEIVPLCYRRPLAGSSGSTVDKEEIYFDFRKQQFYFSEEKQTFCKLPYPTKETFGHYLKSTGHGSDAKVVTATDKWGRNVFEYPQPTFQKLMKEHCMEPFFVFQVFCVGLWCLDEYWYYSLFTLFMLFLFESTMAKGREWRGEETMAVPSCSPRSIPSFECRSDPEFSGAFKSEKPSSGGIPCKSLPFHGTSGFLGAGSSPIFKFPPNFVRQLSTKARRNCSNIGVAQVVAASWSNGPVVDHKIETAGAGFDSSNSKNSDVQTDSEADSSKAKFLSSIGSLAVHAGERLGRGIVTDGITTPIVNTSAYMFKNSAELIDFKEGRHESFEYGRYGNPTTRVAEEKISALEGAESTLLMASGMCASTIMLMALVPAGGHLVTTTDCYRKTRIFIESILPKMGISATVIDPADIDALKSALDQNNVSLFFTESPTNPYLRCVDIELVSKLCHSKGALVCIDGTFATPVNQKALSLGADIVLQSLTKFMAGHNDVLGGCISGSEKVVGTVRTLHHIFGGVINPNASYLIIRGMKTLHLRLQQQNSTALRMAQLLETHPKITRVHYPGLPSHPEHHIAKKQMTGFGGVVSFEVAGDLLTTTKFIDALKIPYIAPSFGGVESIVDQPTIMSWWDLSPAERATFGIKDNLVRFSFGVEPFDDLKFDILQALETI